MTYRELYEMGMNKLQDAEVPEAALDARLLLEAVCHTNRNDLLVHGDRAVAPEEEAQYLEWLEKRAGRIPLQHLTGVQEFMGLEFAVNRHVLIPRQDTEILVEEVMRELHDGMRILDMCTGSGCILVSLLHYSNACKGVGVDISKDALCVARENAGKLLGESSVGDSEEADCRFLQSDLFRDVTGRYEVIVSNPPYIRSEVIETLMPEVRDHEPMQALDGTEDGLFFYRRIVEQAPEYLTGGGRLYFEIGYDQAEEVSALLTEAGFVDVSVVKDYAGLDRVVSGIWRNA